MVKVNFYCIIKPTVFICKHDINVKGPDCENHQRYTLVTGVTRT